LQLGGGGTWIQWISDMHFDNIDFEFDSKLAVDAFNDNQDDATKFRHVISACPRGFDFQFRNSHIEFNRR